MLVALILTLALTLKMSPHILEYISALWAFLSVHLGYVQIIMLRIWRRIRIVMILAAMTQIALALRMIKATATMLAVTM